MCEQERCSKCCVEEFVPQEGGECADVVCRGEDGDPICMACLAEMTNDSDGGGQR